MRNHVLLTLAVLFITGLGITGIVFAAFFHEPWITLAFSIGTLTMAYVATFVPNKLGSSDDEEELRLHCIWSSCRGDVEIKPSSMPFRAPKKRCQKCNTTWRHRGEY